MSELIRKLKEKKYITKIKIKDDISDELLSKEIPQVGSVKIVAAVKEEIGPVRPPYAVMRETNPELMDLCVAQKWAANNDYMTYEEAAVITADMIKSDEVYDDDYGDYRKVSKFKTIKSFNEFQYFTGVEEIKESTFASCSGMTSIAIPDSVTSIGNYAFSECRGLTSIIIPGSVTSIGYSAFDHCGGLTSVIIGNSVTSIGGSAFYSCGKLASVTIGNSVTSIGSNAFQYCNGLTSITIPDSVTSIGSNAFQYCKGLTSITIPDSVTSIGSGVFSNCVSLTSATIGNSVTSIGGSAFQYCNELTSITIGNSVTSIGSNAFYNCTNLTSITIPNTVTSINNSAFSDCTSLSLIVVESNNSAYDSRDNCNAIIETDTNTLIVGCKNTIIPDSVTSIGDRAFTGYIGLASITIPASVTSIGKYAFNRCISLSSITCLATTAPTIGSFSYTFGDSNNNYTGYNTRGTNKLKVPTGATGYDTSYWADPLCNAEKCGFTIEYI